MWGTIGTGLLNFGKSTLGQAAIGAGLGYGIDRLSGGKGGVGAALGGLGGLGNAYSSAGGLMGADNFTGSVADSAMSSAGGLFGQGSKGIYGQAGGNAGQGGTYGNMMQYAPTNTASDMAIRQVGDASANSGFMDGLSGFGAKYGDTIGMAGNTLKGGMDVMNAYGQYKTNKAQSGLYDSQADYTRSLQQMQLADNERKKQALASTQANIDAGFANSGLNNYYSA